MGTLSNYSETREFNANQVEIESNRSEPNRVETAEKDLIVYSGKQIAWKILKNDKKFKSWNSRTLSPTEFSCFFVRTIVRQFQPQCSTIVCKCKFTPKNISKN